MKLVDQVKDFIKRTGRSFIAPDGSEHPDPNPMELPIGFERPESIQDLIKRLVTDRVIQKELDDAGLETFDEADDFDVEDEYHVDSPYEEQFDPSGIVARSQEIRAGAVQDRSQEEIKAARDLVAKVDLELVKSKKSKLSTSDK